jgi:hypothetical protein
MSSKVLFNAAVTINKLQLSEKVA